MLSISVTGTNGYVAILWGTYIDATGTSMSLGMIQTAETTILAQVPEPGLALVLARRARA